MTEHIDILKRPLKQKDTVVFCLAGTSKGMTVGTINRVLPKTVEIRYGLDGYVFRAPEDVVLV